MVKSEESLKELLQHYNRVVVCGPRATVTIILRWFRQEGLLEKVMGTSRLDSRKSHTTYLELEDRPLNEWRPQPDAALLMVCRDPEQIVDVDYPLLASMSWRDHVKLDFLCVGFPKTGTTSLHAALRKNKRIYLPREKETKYGNWKYSYLDAPERFREMYCQNIPEDSLFGGVEPSYFQKASFVYETYGPDVKLIFMLRNPADATYSYFKMMMRRSVETEMRKYYRKYRKYCPDMFQDYMQDFTYSNKDQRFQYDIWIREYLKYFRKEQMMFLIFEEVIREPERILNEVQKFIGVKPKKFTELPHSNSGKEVARDYLCYRINAKLQRMKLNRKEDADPKQRERFRQFQKWVWKYTLIENNEKIPEADREELLEFYKLSIQETERLVGKSLEGLWY